MLFIRPTILRDSVASAYETNTKYTLIRDMQLQGQSRDRKLLQNIDRPLLPELEPTPPELESTPPEAIDLRKLEPAETRAEPDQG
jgi:hypothetical protein